MNRKTEELVFSIIGTLMLIVVLVLLVTMCLKMSHATCTLSWFHPYEWDIYQKCMNDKHVKDIGKKDFFFLTHEYSTSDGEYKIVLDTSSPCMDCWYCYIKDGPNVLYNSNFLHIGKATLNESVCEDLAKKIIKDFNLTWENTHACGEKEHKCLYHKIFN